jgi:hypothetical protein
MSRCIPATLFIAVAPRRAADGAGRLVAYGHCPNERDHAARSAVFHVLSRVHLSLVRLHRIRRRLWIWVRWVSGSISRRLSSDDRVHWLGRRLPTARPRQQAGLQGGGGQLGSWRAATLPGPLDRTGDRQSGAAPADQCGLELHVLNLRLERAADRQTTAPTVTRLSHGLSLGPLLKSCHRAAAWGRSAGQASSRSGRGGALRARPWPATTSRS